MTAPAARLSDGDQGGLDFGSRAGPGRPEHVIRLHPTTREGNLDLLQWGLLPHSTENPDSALRPIQARAETVAGHPLFADAFRRRRAIVPAAEYYQEQTIGETGERYAISRRDGQPVAIAVLWEAFRYKNGEILRTDCKYCSELLRPKPGHCCVFCSYGRVPCPPMQRPHANP